MDKCREEFEKQKYWIGLFRDAVDFDEKLGRYVLNGQRKLYAFHLDSFNEKWAIWQESWQHQQAKVEELQKRVEWLEDRLKATDTLSKMRAAVIGSFNSQEFNARTRRKMMILKRAEQALKGEG